MLGREPARENEWRRREAGRGGEKEPGLGRAEKLVGESPGPGRGGGGTRERDSGAGAEGARRPVEKEEGTGWDGGELVKGWEGTGGVWKAKQELQGVAGGGGGQGPEPRRRRRAPG